VIGYQGTYLPKISKLADSYHKISHMHLRTRSVIDVNSTLNSKEKKLTLLLLCWLFGILALHRFYTGKYLAGSLHLLILGLASLLAYFDVGSRQPLVTVALLALFLWWIIDVLLIIMGKFTDKEGKPIVDWV
jgi:hypothetical protein